MQIIYQNKSILSFNLIIPIDLIKMIDSYLSLLISMEYFREYGKCLVIKSVNFMCDTIDCEGGITFKKRENYK